MCVFLHQTREAAQAVPARARRVARAVGAAARDGPAPRGAAGNLTG
jgi:hypothetical protein